LVDVASLVGSSDSAGRLGSWMHKCGGYRGIGAAHKLKVFTEKK